jgi:hypothetical protein
MLRPIGIALLLTLPAGAATPSRHVLSVALKSETDAPWFAIATDSPANFTSFKLRHPARIVVDFPETAAVATKGAGPTRGLVSQWSLQNLGTHEQTVARLTVELRSDADYTLSSEGSTVELHLVPATARPLVALESERIAERDPAASPSGALAPAEPLPAPPASLPEVAPGASAPAVPVPETTPGLKTDAPHAAATDADGLGEKNRAAHEAAEARALADQTAAKDREAAEQQAVKEREAAEQRELAERRTREAAEREAAREHEVAAQRELAERNAAAERAAAEKREQAERAALDARELKERAAAARRQQLEAERARKVAEKKAHDELLARQQQEKRAAQLAAAQARQEKIEAAKRERLAARGRLAVPHERRVSPAVLGQIGFHASEGGPEVIIHTSNPVTYAVREASALRLFLELDRTGITVANNRRALETRFFGTIVTRIVPHEDRAQQHVSIEIDLASPAPYDIQADGATLRVRFHPLPVTTAVAGGPDPMPEH